MFEFGRTYGNIICPFEDKIIKEIIKVIDKEDSDDTQCMDGLIIDKIFDNDGILDYQDWCKKVVKNVEWMFKSSKLRLKIFEEAKV